MRAEGGESDEFVAFSLLRRPVRRGCYFGLFGGRAKGEAMIPRDWFKMDLLDVVILMFRAHNGRIRFEQLYLGGE